MQKLSIMMLSVRMSYEFDEAKGRTVGSVIKMRGNILGLVLSVEGDHRAGSHLDARYGRREAARTSLSSVLTGWGRDQRASRLRVFIDYDYPATIAAKVLGPMFGPIYARWCVNRMATNAFEGSVRSYIGGA